MADPDLVRDPDEEEAPSPRPRSKYFPGMRPDYVIPGPTRVLSSRAPAPPPPDVQTLPSIQGAIPEVPTAPLSLSEQIAQRRAELIHKLNPTPETKLGKFGHVMNVIGQDIGTALAPGAMYNIPGTIPSMRKELYGLTQLQGQEQEREARAQREKEQTGIQERTLGMEEKKAGLPRMLPPSQETFRTDNATGRGENLWEIPGQPAQWVPEGGYPQVAQPQPLPSAGIPSTLPTTGAQPAPPAAAEGTLPRTTAGAAPPMAAPTPAAQQPPRYTYGKPAEGQIPLSDTQRQQINDEAASFFKGVNKPVDPAFQLKPGATKEDAARLQEMIKAEQSAAGTAAQRADTEQRAREAASRERESLQLRKEESAGKWLRAVDNDDPPKVHLITRGDYEARQREFKPNPGSVPQGEIDKVTDHNTILNEMQGRMNATAESAVRFNWKDSGQRDLVIQAMQRVEESYPDKVIGIPIMDYVATHLKQLGMSGATPETRDYIIDLISLREAMLGMPKEITSGSRMMEKSIEALYATLPSGVTPDRDWAMRQLQTTQSIMDRLRGSRVPIVEGMHQIGKVPELYKYNATNPQTKQEIFSDDKKHWVDEDGRPVR
jgi:hypothetical protein